MQWIIFSYPWITKLNTEQSLINSQSRYTFPLAKDQNLLMSKSQRYTMNVSKVPKTALIK